MDRLEPLVNGPAFHVNSPLYSNNDQKRIHTGWQIRNN